MKAMSGLISLKTNMMYIIDMYQINLKLGIAMDTAKIFQTGRSQAVRLPKEYRFNAKEVLIKRVGEGVLLMPIENPWATIEAALNVFEPGFKMERQQHDHQIRPEVLL
jgi:antitoxin VapB